MTKGGMILEVRVFEICFFSLIGIWAVGASALRFLFLRRLRRLSEPVWRERTKTFIFPEGGSSFGNLRTMKRLPPDLAGDRVLARLRIAFFIWLPGGFLGIFLFLILCLPPRKG
jgi:hypothetical protein